MKCIICDYDITRPENSRHFQTHGLSYREYMYYSKYDTAKLYNMRKRYFEYKRIPKHQCMICGKTFKVGGRHYSIVHNLSTGEYNDLVLHNDSKLKSLQSNYDFNPDSYKNIMIRKELDEEYSTNDSVVSCKICGKETKRIGYHVRVKHGITRTQYENLSNKDLLSFKDKDPIDFRSYLMRGERVTCRICGKSFYWLATHLSQSHKISLDDYKSMSAKDLSKLHKDYLNKKLEYENDPLKVECPICHKHYKYLNNFHLRTHGYRTVSDFLLDYPDTELYKSKTIKKAAFNKGSSIYRYHSDSKNNKFLVRSNTEDMVLSSLDLLGVSYSYETLTIPYYDTKSGIYRNYKPDLVLNNHTIAEIKYSDKEFKKVSVIDKLSSAESFGYNVLKISQDDLDDDSKILKEKLKMNSIDFQ